MMHLYYLIFIATLAIPPSAFGSWTESEKRLLKSLSLTSLSAVPDDPSNQYLLDKRAQKLGGELFFDLRLSGNNDRSCASCHIPEKYFTDGRSSSIGLGVGATARNTPTVVASAWLRWFYWDGRRDSLWSQALTPFEAPNEMGGSRLDVVRQVGLDSDYRRQYEAIFGSFPAVLSEKKYAFTAGAIGNTQSKNNWYRLPIAVKKQINTVYSNIGKALAAYQSTLLPKASRFDLYVEQLQTGKKTTITASDNEIKGIKLFIDAGKTQCLQCHNGPLMTNNGFHNIGTGKFSGDHLDFGRIFGLQSVLMDEFNCVSQYSDAAASQCSQLRFLNKSHHIPLKGAFKTPSLRNIPVTAPYFHDGRFNTLAQVVDYYNQPPTDNGPHELKALNLTSTEQQQLTDFLTMLREVSSKK